MDIIEDNIDKLEFCWGAISRNPNMTIRFFEKYREKIHLNSLARNLFSYDDIVIRKHHQNCVGKILQKKFIPDMLESIVTFL
jgi:hypothetical protein